MNKKSSLVITAIIIVAMPLLMGIALGYLMFSPTKAKEANYNTLPYKVELIKAYDVYNRDCEILLDSIASWDDSFMDTTGETDTYCNYIESREKLDSLIHSEDCHY